MPLTADTTWSIGVPGGPPNCLSPAVWSSYDRRHDPFGLAACGDADAAIAVAQLDEHVHELPALVPVLVHREAARAAVGAGEQGDAGAPRAAAPDVAPGGGAHAPQRAGRPRARPRRARGRRRVLAAQAVRRGMGSVPRRRRGAS